MSLIPTATAYEVYDRQKIRNIFEGVSLEAMRSIVGDGWLGLHEENVFDEEYQPTDDQRNPAIAGVWVVEYEGQVEATLDPDSEVTREGAVRIVIRIQPGAGTELVALAFQKYRELFKDASRPDDIVFFVESPSIAHGKESRSGWWIGELPIRFVGV